MTNKYFSKALLYDERNNSFLMMILSSLIYVSNLLSFFINYFNSGLLDFRQLLSVSYGPFIFFTIIVLIESYNHKSDKYNLMLSEPYKRDTIIITKFISYLIGIIIPILIYGILCSIIVFCINGSFSLSTHTTLWTLWRDIFYITLICSLVSAMIQFFQTIFGKPFMAFLMPIVFFFIMIPLTFQLIVLLTSDKIPYLKHFLLYLKDDLIPNILDFFVQYTINTNNLFSNFILPSLIMLILTLVFLIAAVLLNRKIQFENISEMFMFRWVHTIFNTLLSILFSCITVAIVSVLASLLLHEAGINPKLEFSNPDVVLLFVDFILVILSVFYYKLFAKIQRKRALSC